MGHSTAKLRNCVGDKDFVICQLVDVSIHLAGKIRGQKTRVKNQGESETVTVLLRRLQSVPRSRSFMYDVQCPITLGQGEAPKTFGSLRRWYLGY